jgi:hypothetical protein
MLDPSQLESTSAENEIMLLFKVLHEQELAL